MIGGAATTLSEDASEETLPLNRRTNAWYDAMIGGSAMTLSGDASEEPLNRCTEAWYDGGRGQ